VGQRIAAGLLFVEHGPDEGVAHESDAQGSVEQNNAVGKRIEDGVKKRLAIVKRRGESGKKVSW
jgi:hypothetical protein